MKLSEEFEQRMWLIADPKTKRNRNPGPGEVCVVSNGKWDGAYLSDAATLFLRDTLLLADGRGSWVSEWNDQLDRTREHVVWLLEEAADLAREMGP